VAVHDASNLVPTLRWSDVVGFVAGFGTTCAALPDLIAMLRRPSSAGINPTMAGIMGLFQIRWIYYGLVILSRPVIAWNAIAVVINSLCVGAYFHFRRKEREFRTLAEIAESAPPRLGALRAGV
jgi:MtN3 and saliva related transmembrane protein